MKIVIIVKHH